MRIVSYNILDGGVGRADPLAEVALAQRPDILALVEADDPAVVERIASRAKMDYIHATAGSKGAALLSRWTIRQTIDHAALRGEGLKSLLEATIVDPAGREWVVGVVHLHARAFESDEATRMRQLAVVLDVFEDRRSGGVPHLLVGDFNSNSPVQRIDPRACTQKTQDAWNANGEMIPRKVVQALLDAGYVDTLSTAHPEQAMHSGSFTTQSPGQRVDYVFAWGIDRKKIVSAWIEQDRLAKFASDHFPVGAEISS